MSFLRDEGRAAAPRLLRLLHGGFLHGAGITVLNEIVPFSSKIITWTGKVFVLIEDIRRDPFQGIGKPEPLRHLGSGIWSRRITREHRLVYRVSDDRLMFAQARYHY